MTFAGFELSQKQGFYDKNPGADLPVKQLTRGTVTSNSKGLRLGRLAEIRNIIYEEMEKAFQGSQTAQQAMDNAVSPRQQGAAGVREVGEGLSHLPQAPLSARGGGGTWPCGPICQTAARWNAAPSLKAGSFRQSWCCRNCC